MIKLRPQMEPLHQPSMNWPVMGPVMALGMIAMISPLFMAFPQPKKDEPAPVVFRAEKIRLVPEKPKEKTVKFRITHESTKICVVALPTTVRTLGAREIKGLWWEFQKDGAKKPSEFADFLKSKGYEIADDEPVVDVVVD